MSETLNPSDFSPQELERYSRHLIMPEVTLVGQKKLKQAKVLIIGAGGLGSPISMYLAAAGVGTLGIVDYDIVEASNLQRQIIYSQNDIGRDKLTVVKERLTGINPYINIHTYKTPIQAANAFELISPYDIIVDGTDNFPARYLVNDACVLLKKINIYGSIFQFEGQISVFDSSRGPCYRCLYPHPPKAELIPNCAQGGVLGVLPGIIGTIQAMEAIKLILGCGQPLLGRLLLFSALKMKFSEFKLTKNPLCPICGDNPSIHELIDYQQACSDSLPKEWEITPAELNKRIKDDAAPLIIDVREVYEYKICNLPGAQLIPLQQIENKLKQLKPDQEIVVHCRSGKRSAQAVHTLRNHGFTQTKNLVGGILAWADDIDPTMAKY